MKERLKMLNKIFTRLGLLTMFGLYTEKKVRELVLAALLSGNENGFKFGVTLGKYEAGDPGVIFSARAEQEVEKILNSKGVE